MNQSPERKSTPMWRRAVSFCLAMLMLIALIPTGTVQVSAVSAGDTLYLKPNSNWLEDSARFAAYFYVNGTDTNTWVSMTDSDGDGYYECTVPSGSYNMVIFVRMNGGTTANNWGNKWNQTGDLSIPSNSNCYTITDGSWDSGSWSTFSYALAGSMNGWSTTANTMTGSGTTVSCTVSLSAGTYTFKIFSSANVWYGNSGTINDTASGWVMDGSTDCTLVASGGTYTFTFDTSTKKLTVTAVLAECSHSYSSKVTTAATCTTAGVRTYTCSKCGDTYTESIAATGHNYTSAVTKEPTCTTAGVRTYTCQNNSSHTYTESIAATGHSYENGYCTVCGAADSGYSPDYYLVGSINGENYGCEDDYQNLGQYKFVNGKLEVFFETDSYVFLKTGDNANWYMTKSYATGTSATFYHTSSGAAEKMFIPGGVKICLTLKQNSDGSLTLSYTEASTVIYFDATLSKLSYNGSHTTNGAHTIPAANGDDAGSAIYCYFWGSSIGGGSVVMEQVSATTVSGHTYSDVWQVKIPDDATHVLFYSSSAINDFPENASKTVDLEVPSGMAKPCFYADSSDSALYDGAKRDGYWGEAYNIRSAEYMKSGSDVVDISSGKLVQDSEVIYVNSTFYDYYSDYELNGSNRDSYKTTRNSEGTFGSYQNWYVFRHINQAMSDYYSSNKITVPIYVGHFQPDWNNYDEQGNPVPWGYQFRYIARTLDLYGFMDGLAYSSGGDKDQKYFMSVNNSNMDLTPSMNHVYSAAQGIVSGSLSNGTVTSAGSSVELPFFNEDFLAGSNSKNTKLGEVFANVAFPFTQQDIHNNGIEYWVFDSSETTLSMMANSDSSSAFDYYLTEVTDSARAKYQNLDSGSNPQTDADGNPAYGFFPFNSGSTAGDANTYNYGFGTSMSLTFNLTESGTVVDKYGKEKPIVFEFSGDDDLWIFIDGKLVLDIGGSHGKVSGTIDFSTMTATVSSVKSSGGSSTSGENVSKSFTLTGNNTDDHTLTLYYMERGMWESNMRITFNFFPAEELLPETTSMTVTKEWDVEKSSDIASSISVQLQSSTNGTTWSKVQNVTLSASNNWTHTFTDLPKYTDSTKATAHSYRVVELNGNTALSGGEISNGLIVTYGPVYGNSGTGYGQLITNSSPPAGLTIAKALEDGASGAWTGDLFPIQVTLNGSSLPATLKTSKDRTITVSSDGIIYLEAGESVTLSNVEAGTTYVVTELDTETGSSYMSSYAVTTTSTVNPTVTANQVSGTLTAQSSTTVTVTNSERESEHIVVIDFGLSVDITVMETDLKAMSGEIYCVGSASGVSLGFGSAPGSAFGTTATGDHGTLVINGDQVRYTPTKGDMQMDTSDSFAFVIRYKESDGSYGYYYGKVTVVPAANIYYEDSFLTFTDSTEKYTKNGVSYGYWSAEISTDGATQAEDRPGEDALDSIDANNVYGYDDAYGECSEYSLDAARSVTVDATTGSASACPKATFTFTGTGFDVVSLTNSKSGAILVEVWTEDNSNKVVSYIVNNYYGYTYNSTTQKWEIVESNDSSVLYQVPSIKVTDLTYGTYNVIIKAAYLKSMDDEGVGSYTIWVDAIRTYNPAQNENGENKFESIYEQDGESNPHLTTVKKLILAASTFDDGNTTANGVVYVDGKSTGVTIADYADEGPNNETYLKNNNGIAFKLRATTSAEPQVALQIGAKLAIGSSAELHCNETKIATLETATNMFYKLGTIEWTKVGSYWESEPIILVCKNAGTDSILSLTDIKVTGADAGYITADSDNTASGANLQAIVDEDVMEAAQLYMAVAEEPEEPTDPAEPTTPEEPTEPETPTEPTEKPTESPDDPDEDNNDQTGKPGYGFFDWSGMVKRFISFLFGRFNG